MLINNIEYEHVTLRHGLNVVLREDLYEKVSSRYDIYAFWERHIIAQSYFPQIVQFIATMLLINSGVQNFSSILYANLLLGISFTIIWNCTPIYKIPGLSFLSALIGGNLFRNFIHFIFLSLICMLYYKNGWLILYCALSGIITMIIKCILSTPKYTYKRNDRMAQYSISVFEYADTQRTRWN